MNPDDIATETIMPEAFLYLAREMVAQKSPEAVAMAALAWALRHAPVDGGCTLEISGHRIERIAPEPDPWPTEPLIVATREGAHLTPAHRVWARSDEVRSIYTSITDSHEAHPGDTLTNVIPVTVVPVAGLEALRDAVKALGYETTGTTGMPGSLLDTALNLLSATDALGVDL